ncbi:cation diffusion facilitator family transporter [Brevibacillus laterosporus]|uniref:Cation diffusion facilitator family transporter n=1 Tax=Brevibacillus laterosporus TaxID=1465 RepID=A0AAP8QD77_BRELA|nr:cation diffusion facilitator family transporter [Brevibacillus laterosporus]MCR8978827.1 cation diffusion facilitator family transporter [Brevibacillus laterosporus]MCZ0805983.1 cation diffusion facilitator family transporter [Brevibacillus laterosporus]MCZ0824270.1 cation diffusion facilitator family transporter [Brevibacillus laterosporus]MCZ0848177.1 cation diffusion facilitator family transporter [Brevibacillus laterosporus]MED1664403.1 cation diffusion facilitator family transporter [B
MENRLAKAQFAAWIGIVGNLLLALVKLLVGIVADSRAMVADAVHSASDVIGSVAVLIGLRAAEAPPDQDHPYGHGKAESISAIIVSILLAIVGFEIAYSSYKSLYEPLEPPGMLAVWTALGSMVIKEWMFRYKYHLGKKLNSQSLIANAWEHRSDVYSSFAALIGVGGAILGEKMGVAWTVYLDPIAGIFVSFLVLKTAYHILKESIHSTMDHVLHEEDALPLRETVMEVEGVLRIDELWARETGHYQIVDIKISVAPYITVEDGHRIGKNVKRNLMEKHQDIRNVFVHINPYDEKGKSWDEESAQTRG